MSLSPTLAAVRFGTGLSPHFAAPAGAGAVMERLLARDHSAAAFPQPGWDQKVQTAIEWGRLRRARNDGGDAEAQAYRRHTRAMVEDYHADLARIVARAATTGDGFRERLHWFWADHFTVTDGAGLRRKTVAGYYEDAVRPFVARRFSELLTSAVTHPAMVVYLDQNRSIGPNSPRGRRGGGLNENLAREVLELHTSGVGGSYTQQDVRQLAELLTGLAVGREGQRNFRPNFAEPGAEVIMGRSYGREAADPGAIDRALQDLSVHPDTARHLSAKLARHFVSDTPDPDLVAAMTATWLATDGDLPQVYGVMLDHPASAVPELQKVRRPIEFLAAAVRALGAGANLPRAGNRTIRDLLFDPLKLMGQSWQRAPGPDGWPEEAEAWITPQGLAARIEWAMFAPEQVPDLPDPRRFVETALAELATPRTRFAAQAAESRVDGIGLVLSSPEFQRR